jgi:predicted ester cyclase
MTEMPAGRPEPPPEQPIDFTGLRLSPRKEVVRAFYKELWDRPDTSLIPRLLHEGFTFRGSLGPSLVSHAEFARYVDWVTAALGDYTSDILALVEEGDCVAAKLRFHGIHRAEMFGIPPTGRRVWWYGAPLFTFEGDRVRDLWVLGDVHGLIERLRAR